MGEYTFTASLGGIELNIQTAYPQNADWFRSFACGETGTDRLVRVTKEELETVRSYYPPEMSPATVEYNELCTRVGDLLLPFCRFLFHGVAFLWRGKAWIFTAPSGTGKTTQYVLWKGLYGDEIQILNGDKPILEACPDGTIWVHPSPWMGKEGMRSMFSAPLGGMVYLQQGRENQIVRMTQGEAAVPIFCQLLFTAASPRDVELACCLEETLLKAVPVWRLINRGDEASARLTHDTILKWEENRHET